MKRRVMHVSHSAGLSGAEQALFRLTSSMDRDRFTSVVVLPSDGPLLNGLAAAGIETHISPIRWWIPATHWSAESFLAQISGLEERWQDLACLAERERVDLIHTNTLVTIEGALAAAALGIPHVWHSRGRFDQQFPPSYLSDLDFFFSIIDKLGDHIVCVSKAVRDQAAQYLRGTPCSTIPDGFDPQPSFPSNRTAFLTEFGLPAETRAIICIGGVQRRKAQKDLVEAFAQIRPVFPEAVLLFCGELGDPAYVDDIRALISGRNLESGVKFPGFRNDVAGIVQHCELVVQPSHSEGFGLAILESMAAGKPVIATRSGGPEDIIEHGISGLLVSPGAPTELAQTIASVLNDKKRSHRIGDAARLRAALFTVSASARRFEELLSTIGPSKQFDPSAICVQIASRFRNLCC